MGKYPEPPEWKDANDLRLFDGMFTDLYAEAWRGEEDWAVFLGVIAKGPWRYEFRVDGEPAEMIRAFQWVDGINPHLFISVGNVKVGCYFFGENSFELTFDQRELATEFDYRELLSFMQVLATNLQTTILV